MKNGKHLIIDAYGCNRRVLMNRNEIVDMLLTVTSEVGLRPLSDPMIWDVDETMQKKEDIGMTGAIIFMESHFTFHAFPERNYFSADIYSCKDFEHDMIVTIIGTIFEAKEMTVKVIYRGQKL